MSFFANCFGVICSFSSPDFTCDNNFPINLASDSSALDSEGESIACSCGKAIFFDLNTTACASLFTRAVSFNLPAVFPLGTHGLAGVPTLSRILEKARWVL